MLFSHEHCLHRDVPLQDYTYLNISSKKDDYGRWYTGEFPKMLKKSNFDLKLKQLKKQHGGKKFGSFISTIILQVYLFNETNKAVYFTSICALVHHLLPLQLCFSNIILLAIVLY